MRTVTAAILALAIISAVPAAAVESITISDYYNRVQFHDFGSGDLWNITLKNSSVAAYRFSGAVGTVSSGNYWTVWFGKQGGSENGIRLCVVPGNYSVYANGSHGSGLIEKNGSITVEAGNVCEPPIPPIPELSTAILTSAGLLGILIIGGKHKRN